MSATQEQLAQFPYQCVVCGEKLAAYPPNGQCSFGHPNLRNVQSGDGIYDNPSEEQVAHFKKKTEMCWNQKKRANGGYDSHAFLEQRIPVVNLSTNEYHVEVRCGNCGRAYTSVEGRAATPQEIQLCKQGKIAAPTAKDLWMGSGRS